MDLNQPLQPQQQENNDSNIVENDYSIVEKECR
jgi:hypothetical protein